MDLLLDEHFRLQEQVRSIEIKDESRKLLIRLAVLKMLSLRGSDSTKSTKQQQSPQPTSTIPENISEKLHDYELRISVLKLQLSTKEKVHEAQVDELKDLVGQLQKQLDERTSIEPKPRLVSNPVRTYNRTSFLSPPTSSGRLMSMSSRLLSPGQSVFSATSPIFAKLEVIKGKGNSFADFGLESIASKASLKLSQTEEKKKKPEVYFSSPNSSVESTPRKKEGLETILRKSDEVESSGLALPDPNANLTNISVSDGDETFQSANATLSEDTSLGSKKKKKIHLLSTHATKIMLEQLQGKGLNVEDEDLNSLNYYQDDNFQEENSSPIRQSKRSLDDGEDSPRKRHVFKI